MIIHDLSVYSNHQPVAGGISGSVALTTSNKIVFVLKRTCGFLSIHYSLLTCHCKSSLLLLLSKQRKVSHEAWA